MVEQGSESLPPVAPQWQSPGEGRAPQAPAESLVWTILKQPLLHFLVLGGALFGIYQLVNRPAPAEDDQTIVVDEPALLRFMQFRSRAFDPEFFARQWDSMDADQRQRVIDDFVREEVLYREARKLGLEQDDYVIRRRLVQKLEFITQGFAQAASPLTDEELELYFRQHREDYRVQPHVTFTHVFFDPERRGEETAAADALTLRDELNENAVPFADGARHGDRFPYHANYVERIPDLIASHFGTAMQQELFNLAPGDRWQGPFRSRFGQHLVMLTNNAPGRLPELEEVRDQVRADAEQAKIRAETERAVNEIINRYDVRSPDGMQPQPQAASGNGESP